MELESVRKEVDELQQANTTTEERNAAFEMNLKKLSKKMDGMAQTLDETVEKNSTLKKEFKNLHKEVQNMSSLASESVSLPFLSDPVKASLVLGQLCWRIQAMLYQKVLPNSYDSRKSYKVNYIEEDIQDLEDKREKDEVNKKWAELKKRLKWNKRRHTRAMKSIQDNINLTAHPDLNEEEIVWSTNVMEQNGKLTDWLSPACVHELIEMWKQLVQPE